ncbi:MAG: epoxyqueuosine reductase QueH [Tannerella sp.]|jgi:predicted adenine nucleotide alpha hydrolase (AANH) superfamily ATPase|nr:epoxyqueuosine reductase QueH [Tannerella sp.]
MEIMRAFAWEKNPASQFLPVVPKGAGEVLLHACCAPCSGAVVESMLANGVQPTIFYFNPNIFPQAEYERRKAESKRHAESLGLPFAEGDYDHAAWLGQMHGLEQEPERGARCMACFRMRLSAAAQYAHAHGFTVFASTLASSRWKDLHQINRAGREAAASFSGLVFPEQNWRRGGLSERRHALIKQYGFYNQTYCGCEFGLRNRPTVPAM